MNLYLVRHGQAVSEDLAGSDRDRWLAAEGRHAVRGLGQLLRRENVAPDIMLASPLPRAMQTAELLAGVLDYFGEIQTLRALAPDAEPRPVLRDLAARGVNIVLVGHEPNLQTLGGYLLGQAGFPPFRTAQCAAILDGKPGFVARADIMQIQPFWG